MNKVLKRSGFFANIISKDFKGLFSPKTKAVEIEKNDINEPVTSGALRRLPWLVILLILGTGVSATVGAFESVLAQLPVIMCFQSLILDMAGNVGTQSLAVAIRVLMDKEVGFKKKLKLVIKECNIGLVNGVILGVLSFVIIGVYLSVTQNEVRFAFSVSACLGVAMVVAMTVSSFAGTIIPVAFQKVGIDPAVASGPLITTVNDLVAVVTYYGISWLILIHFMHLG